MCLPLPAVAQAVLLLVVHARDAVLEARSGMDFVLPQKFPLMASVRFQCGCEGKCVPDLPDRMIGSQR